jgi:hypothetical protein
MKTQLPITSEEPIALEEEHRVLQFRLRPRATPRHQRGDLIDWRPQGHFPPAAEDLSRYERDREDPDDFHHRMLANTAAFAFTVALTALGIWLAMSIADLRNTQDCVLMGRRDCAHIPSPHI